MLVVVAIVLAWVSLLSTYLRWQLFDPGTFSTTAAELVRDDAVRERLASELTAQLFANVDVRLELERELPADQKALAAPLSAALRQLGERTASELLARPRIQKSFIASATKAQAVALRALEDDLGPVGTKDGYVVLDLHETIVELATELSFLGSGAAGIPADVGVIRLVPANRFEAAQDLTARFRTIAWLLPWLSLGLAVLGIWLAAGRRRLELRAIGVGLVLAGVTMLALRKVAGAYVVDQLSATAGDEATTAVWRILTDLLAGGARTFVITGLAALVVAWLIGRGALATQARYAFAPVLARRSYSHGIAAMVLLALIWWRPTPQLGRFAFVVVAAVLLVLAAETVRRMVRAESPEAAAAEPGAWVRTLVASRERLEQPRPRLAAELETLARLRAEGALDETDYEIAKELVLR